MNEAPQTAVIGGGRMARAIGRVLTETGVDIRFVARQADARAELLRELPGAAIVDGIEEAVTGAAVVFLAVPAPALAEAAERYGEFATGDQVVLTACRGVGPGFTLPHELIRSKSCVRKIGVFGGPLHVRELGTGRAIPTVLASRFFEVIAVVRALTERTPIRIHESRDVVGVEVAGAISNVTALAAGMAAALDLGETAKGLLVTHGLVESRRLGLALGADEHTFTGLAGIGDLIPRHVSSTDRHLVVGSSLALGASVEAAVKTAGSQHVEGLVTAVEAAAKARSLGLNLPLVFAVERVVRKEVAAQDVLEEVLRLDVDLDLDPDRERKLDVDVDVDVDVNGGPGAVAKGRKTPRGRG